MISIDFNKYKRFFAFGCSFTSHIYPTWADIIASEMPNVEYHNLGCSGGGNLFITVRLAEANMRFNFNKDDLIMVMYSTFYREDRWFDGGWKLGGNIYNNPTYDDAFVRKYADPAGYVIRDLALIESSRRYIESLDCDSHFMMATGWDCERKHGDYGGHIEKEAFTIYEKTLSKFHPSMFELEFNNTWSTQVSYLNNAGDMIHDPHPRPRRYKNYLEKIGIPLTQASELYVQSAEDKLLYCKKHSDLEKAFGREWKIRDNAYENMF